MPTLLLADDSITVQRVITLTFAEEPINVVTVADGRQAMERLASQRPDIVLAGTTLPHVSGYDLARFMRTRPDLQRVPVLLLSGAFETIDTARLEASGANGIVEKPIEPTIVIGRVKELLGLRTEVPPATAGRLVTAPGGPPPERKAAPAHTPPSVTSTRPAPSQWDQLRDRTGLDANTRSVEEPASRADDYLDTLDDAFDTLDRQLSGRTPAAKQQPQQRNPPGPLAKSGGSVDPRSPGRRPAEGAQAANPVFEVDNDWFGSIESPARAEAREGRREIAEDLRDPELQGPAKIEDPPNPIYEVDDQWFVEDEKARAQRATDQHQLAAEMGLNDIDLIAPVDSTATPAPVEEDVRVSPPTIVPMRPIAEVPTPASSMSHPVASPIADDFAALLAFEQGEQPDPPRPSVPAPAPALASVVTAVAPELTDDMLNQIAARVAEKLMAGAFGEQLSAAMRDTVRRVVSETSERQVRDEIERIRSKSRT